MKPLNKKEIKKFFKKDFKRDKDIVVILENLQYAKNVAGIFRTADAAGVSKIYLTGISAKPPFGKELKQVSRTKEDSVPWIHLESNGKLLDTLRKKGYYIVAVEITDEAKNIKALKTILEGKKKVALIFGNEVSGIPKKTLEKCDMATFIPMYGKGASLNVASSAAIALFSF